MMRPYLLLLTLVLGLAPIASSAQSFGAHAAAGATPPIRLASAPSKPLFAVGISGGITGARMVASVYADGRVVTVRDRGPRQNSTTQTQVPVSRGAIQAVLDLAVRHHVFAIPRSVQDSAFGADIPVLSFTIRTSQGVRAVHVMGTESSHPAGTASFFPVWHLLHALAGYPPQII